MGLLACPFCREMFPTGERETCPVCGVDLTDFERLPPSPDALADEEPQDPDREPLPILYAGRGRGPLVVLAVVGLVLFALPWLRETLPNVVDYSGVAVARRLVWPWGAGVGWFVLIPTALSRRSVYQMRGARVAVSFLAAVPGLTVALLWAFPPQGTRYVPLRFTYGWPFYATLVVSLVALAFAFRFGGRPRGVGAPVSAHDEAGVRSSPPEKGRVLH